MSGVLLLEGSISGEAAAVEGAAVLGAAPDGEALAGDRTQTRESHSTQQQCQ
jgi:hypothetical protein